MDAARLEEAIKFCRAMYNKSGSIAILADAAEAHLATLPKTRPAWFVIWRTRGAGACVTEKESENGAAAWAIHMHDCGCPVIATVGPFEVPDNG